MAHRPNGQGCTASVSSLHNRGLRCHIDSIHHCRCSVGEPEANQHYVACRGFDQQKKRVSSHFNSVREEMVVKNPTVFIIFINTWWGNAYKWKRAVITIRCSLFVVSFFAHHRLVRLVRNQQDSVLHWLDLPNNSKLIWRSWDDFARASILIFFWIVHNKASACSLRHFVEIPVLNKHRIV